MIPATPTRLAALAATALVTERPGHGAEAEESVTTAPAFLCQPDLDAGRLVRLLPRWTMPGNDLLLLHGATRELPVRVKIFIEYMLNRFRGGPGVHGLVRANDRPRRRR